MDDLVCREQHDTALDEKGIPKDYAKTSGIRTRIFYDWASCGVLLYINKITTDTGKHTYLSRCQATV